MSASPIPTREHGLQLPPRQRNWIRVWSLKDCMAGSRYECECCGRPVQGGAWEQVSAATRVRIEAAEMEAAQVEKETEYWL